MRAGVRYAIDDAAKYRLGGCSAGSSNASVRPEHNQDARGRLGISVSGFGGYVVRRYDLVSHPAEVVVGC